MSPVVYPESDRPLRERTVAAVADAELRGNLDKAAAGFHSGRERMRTEHGFDEMRARAREIRQANIRDLPALHERFAARAVAAGARVVRVADADEACRYVLELAAARGARVVAKSKSMATEEIKLNEALEAAGLRVVETDLGEWILQLAHERPAHIVAPAVHMNKDQVRRLFETESGTELPLDREALVAHARLRLREQFSQADIGISGVNMAIAETGTICVVENEGNGRLVTALPRVHVAVMGMERIVADWDDAAHLLQVLPMAAIADDAATYVNLVTGPRRPGEHDGPEELHVVVLDGGRSALIGTEFEEALHCIRCGACLYACPMWKTVGGQAYGSPYSGPIGAVITPLLEGLTGERSAELPFLSSLCGACHEACPVGIPLHDLLVRIRGRLETGPHLARRRWFRLWARAWSNPIAYRATIWAGRVGLRLLGRGGWAGRLPGPGRQWSAQRDLPTRWPPRP